MNPEVFPSLESVEAIAGAPTHVALRMSLLADSETPISLFSSLNAPGVDAFFLESVEGGELVGRYSFLGVDPAERIELESGQVRCIRPEGITEGSYDDPLDYLRTRLAEYEVLPHPGLPRFQGGLVGYIGYDAVKHFESLGELENDGVPEAVFLLIDTLIIYDHVAHRVELVTHAQLEGDRAQNYQAAVAKLQSLFERVSATVARPALRSVPGRFPLPDFSDPQLHCNVSDEEFARSVDDMREAIRDGEVFQVVLSRRWTLERDVDAFELYRALRATNPSPYMFYLALGSRHVVGASPEVLVRVEDGELLLRPIAGTRARGVTPEEDMALEQDLLADEKELAEHRMLVDLARNDAGRVAEVGTVRVEREFHIERYSHVMHIVSDVRARLRDGFDAFDAFRASFPAGTVSGAPKVRAMELIGEREEGDRGIYAGAVGYFDFSGNMDTCIAIRTMVLEPGKVHVQAGAGIVFDSIGANEAIECKNKARGALAALELAERAHS